jgi:hypothetical protein
MLSADDNKPIGKPGQRKRNAGQESKKSEARRRKSAQPQPQPDEVQVAPVAAEAVSEPNAPTPEPEAVGEPNAPAPEVLGVAIAPTEEAISEASAPAQEPIAAAPEPFIELNAPASAALTVFVESSAIVPIAPEQTVPVGYRAIANAYCNYALQSLDRTRCFFENLAGVQSVSQALELEIEFARQTYEGFVTESQKICELHGELVSQRLKRWEGFVARMIPVL